MLIHLSFDDGPGPSTLPLLDVLRAASCRATFFLLGRNLAGALDVAARMAREGHRLGNHTHSHVRPHALADDVLIDEIETTDALIRDAYRRAGVPAPGTIPLRLPYGLMPADNRAGVLARLRREHTGWTAILDDWQRPAPSPQALVDAMCAHVDASTAQQRDVLFCLHDGSRHGEARPNTVEAVRLFLNRSRIGRADEAAG
ncbi:polysaccharide deacetylase family protein [Burkholderia metallica]